MVIWQAIFSLKPYAKNSFQRERALLAYRMLAFIVVAYTLFATFVRNWGPNLVEREYNLWAYLQVSPAAWVYAIGFYGFMLVAFILIRTGRLENGLWALIGAWFTASSFSTFIEPGTFAIPVNFGALVAFMILSTLFKEERGAILALGVGLAAILFDYPSDASSSRLAMLFIVAGIGVLCFLFVGTMRLSRAEGESRATRERLKLADINTRITREAAQNKTLRDVLNLALRLILENYPDFYHVQVFLIDKDGIQARLEASTGEAGRTLLDRNHSLAVGSLSVVGQTALRVTPMIARAGVRDSIHRFNDLLPNTLLETAFPLRIGETIIGVLDMQSTTLEELLPDDLATFQSLADSLSLVIDNVRQFERAQQQVIENQRLNEQTRKALDEVERLNQRLIGRAWSEYLQDFEQDTGLTLDLMTGALQNDTSWTPALSAAASENALIQGTNYLAVPLRVRGQVIGALEFELDGQNRILPEDVELVQEMSERFGLAAENVRLVEESQRIAQREALINEISSRFQATNDVEGTLTEAARSLRDTLKVDKIVIRLGMPSKPTPVKG